MDKFIAIAFTLISTTYGHGEYRCGDIGKPKSCVKGAVTASGEVFDPELPTMAVFAPTAYIMRPRVIPVRLGLTGACKFVRVNDKGNPRYIGKRGFDLTPASITLLGGKSSKYWSGKLFYCIELEGFSKYEVLKWNINVAQ